MKLFKLWVHQQTFSEDPLIVNPREFPSERVGDILEIYHPEDDNTRLLLQINSIRSDFQQKDTISIEQSVANIFQLRTYCDVQVNKVNPKDVAVDLVEVLIKDQYVSRSDMWRLANSISDTCVYVGKKIQFAGIRAQVNEIWVKDQKVSCGVISKNTRVVFRSSSALMNLYIQMSQEMWDFDLNGDLSFEKTVNGFLYELFTQWKESNTNQEVTIILFSRTFYEAKSLDEFPEEMKLSVQQDPYGQFYEDFYQVVVHGERRDDWLPVLVTLKRYFTEYPKYVNCCEDVRGVNVPRGRNSTSYEGNFLEAVNLSMNIFERYHIDRTFDRTGQTVAIISPGTGAFEVDRELSSLTKQRMIDSGVAADLVCMAEQPLHTVPLLKFFDKSIGQTNSLGDDYSIPHWINHSFYTLPNSRTAAPGAYVPRIRVPDAVLKHFGKDSKGIPFLKGFYNSTQNYSENDEQPNQIPDIIDYDGYDAKIFRLSSNKQHGVKTRSKAFSTFLSSKKPHSSAHDLEWLSRSGTFGELSGKQFFSPEERISSQTFSKSIQMPPPKARKHSQQEQIPSRLATSVGNVPHERPGINSRKFASDENFEYIDPSKRLTVGSVGTSYPQFNLDHRGPQRALINPFRPSAIPCKWTCNRHRWSDAFPKGPEGDPLFRHHTKIHLGEIEEKEAPIQWNDVEEAGAAVVEARKHALSEAQSSSPEDFEVRFGTIEDDNAEEQVSYEEKELESSSIPQEFSPPSLQASYATHQQQTASRRRAWARHSLQFSLINPPVEKDWTAAVKTSVDWKSLVTPALLPLTTNYYPDKRTLNTSYLEYNYELLIDFDEDYGLAAERMRLMNQRQESAEDDIRVGLRLLSADQVFEELVSQRLAKGFQICRPRAKKSPKRESRTEIRRTFSAVIPQDDQSKEVLLCLGRLTHKLNLAPQQSQIVVTRYQPCHPFNSQTFHYVYRLRAGMRKSSSVASAKFSYDELNQYNWNYLDHYICGDDPDFNELLETLKYLKARFLLLPSTASRKPSGGSQGELRKPRNKRQREEWVRVEGLMRFLEGLNRIKRSSAKRRPLSPKDKRLSRTPDRKTSRVDGVPKVGSPLPSKTLAPESTPGTEPSSPVKEGISTQPSSTSDETKTSPDDDSLSLQSSLERIAEAMQATPDGLNFLPELKGLKSNSSFLSIEGSSWMIQHVDGVSTRAEAVCLGQKMMEANIIQHASESKKQRFVDGFLIYFFTPKSAWQKPLTDSTKVSAPSYRSPFAAERYEFELLKMFRSEWFEVSVWPSKPEDTKVSFLASDQAINAFHLEGAAPMLLSQVQSPIRRTMSIPKQLGSGECECGPAYKTVYLDADPHCKSDRPERCTVRYHGNYSPDHAFEIEVHWIAATGSIVCEMVQSWSRRASSNGFVLVPAPICPFPNPDPDCIESDPLRLPVFIPLNLSSCLEGDSQNVFQGFEPATQKMRMLLFQEAILQRFDFLRDCPHGTGIHLYQKSLPVQCCSNDYVHNSGVAFVRITTTPQDSETDRDNRRFSVSAAGGYRTLRSTSPRMVSGELPQSQYPSVGFLWMNNYMLTKRWRTAATGDSEVTMKLMKEFEDFCGDTNSELKAFWNSSRDSIREATGSSKVDVGDETPSVPVKDSGTETKVAQPKEEDIDAETTVKLVY